MRGSGLGGTYRLLATLLVTGVCIAGAGETARPSGNGMSDSLSWLDEIKGERALEWVRAQNARTAKQLGTSKLFQRNYERAKDVHVEQAPMPLTVPGMVHDGWLFDFLVDKAHPRGLWRRIQVHAFLAGATEWQDLIDVTALAAAEDRPLTLVLPVRCHMHRCIVKMEGASKDVNRGWDLREFDLETRSFAKDGFSLPTSATFAIWQDLHTVLVATDFGPGTMSRRQLPVSLREWHRGKPPSKEIFRGDTRGSWGVIPHERPSTDGRLLTIFSYEDTDKSRSLLIEPDGQVVPTLLPPGVTIHGTYQNHVIVQNFSSTEWKVGNKVVRSGSLASIPRREIGRPSPTVRIILEPQEREAISGVAITRAGLLVTSYKNIRGRLSRLTIHGDAWIRHEIALPDHGSVRVTATDTSGSTAFVTYESFIQPPTLYAVDAKAGTARPLTSVPASFDASSLLIEQQEALSKDGTRVPYFVVRAQSLKLDGRSPVLLYGYGALGNMKVPHYDGALGRLWLNEGGVFVVANIRGGGEFGPAWHVTGLEKQRTYEDFVAVAEDLIRRKITSPRHLGIRGHSNGGLLVGVTLNTRPELFNAAIIEHPVLDLHTHTDGADSVEYGAWSNPEERAFLERTSPLQNLQKRQPFPVPLLKTAIDDTVLPSAARKYAAKLASFGMPFYYYESAGGRHALADTPQNAAYYDALLYTYLAQHLM